MSTHIDSTRAGIASPETMWRGAGAGQKARPDPNHVSTAKMAWLASTLDRMAPKPGAVIYLESARIPSRLAKMEPVIFSAFDANTHLQVARIYLTDSFASAVDFLNFVRQKFPFSIGRVRTAAVEPFHVNADASERQRFSSHLEAQGILHTIISDPARDEFLSVFGQFSFARFVAESGKPVPDRELIREFIAYLFYYNNQRKLLTLRGKTPMEKLRSFGGFDELEFFDPFAVESHSS